MLPEADADSPLSSISIRFTTDADIRRRSSGRVVTERINIPQSGRPDPEGLDSSLIFGCHKNFTCDCGRYSRMPKDRTEFTCPYCKIPLTSSQERRTRSGHIELPHPVIHPWHLFQPPFLLSEILGLTPATIQTIADGRLALVQAGLPGLPKGSLVSTDDYNTRFEAASRAYMNALNNELDAPFGYAKRFAVGGRALKVLLEQVNLQQLDHEIEEAILNPEARQKMVAGYEEWLQDPFAEEWARHAKRLREAKKVVPKNEAPRAIAITPKNLIRRQGVIRDFMRSGIAPANLIMSTVPVLPPALRPIIPSGDTWITPDLNVLYGDILRASLNFQTHSQSGKESISPYASAVAQLQVAVNHLYDNGSDGKFTKEKDRLLKSLSDRLTGKSGRFRKNLFGKRTDFTGRSVITSGPDLALDEVGIPYEMARELFVPFTAAEIIKVDTARKAKAWRIKRLAEPDAQEEKPITPRAALKKIGRDEPIAMAALEKVMADQRVMLNRAPSLHRHSVQAFKPVLKYGTRAITLNNVVLGGFNADYDGDQMGVHVVLAPKPLEELKTKMDPKANMLAPATGGPMHMIGQEAVLGMYYLTLADPLPEGTRPRVFSGPDEAHAAWNAGQLALHQRVEVRFNGKRLPLTYGRLLVREVLPETQAVPDKPLGKKLLTKLLSDAHAQGGPAASSKLLIAFRDLGFRWSTLGGLSFGIEDLKVPPDKWEIVQGAKDSIAALESDPNLTKKGRFERLVQIWADATEKVTNRAIEEMAKADGGKNSFYMMYDSGARGTKLQVRQVAAMRGMFTNIVGNYVKHPVLANLREGQSTYDYFVSCHGTRKSFGDMALRTAQAGYLTRRLVEAAHNVAITSADCGTTEGLAVLPLLSAAGEVKVGLAERITGRVLAKDLTVEGRSFAAGSTLTAAEADFLGTRVAAVTIRHPLSCQDPVGICQACYGLDLTTKLPPEIGLAVGVIAGQSVGEPATQMTLRSKHTGGVSEIKATEKPTLKAPVAAVVTLSEPHKDGLALSHSNRVIFTTPSGQLEIPVPMGTQLTKSEAKAGEPVAELPVQEVALAPSDGVATYRDGRLFLETPSGELEIPLWKGMRLVKGEGSVARGEVLALGAGLGISARDITGGLPRIDAILEMRSPKNAAVLSPASGTVRFGPVIKKKRLVEIVLPSGEVPIEVPGKAKLLVVAGQKIRAGMPLTDGDIPIHLMARHVGPVKAAQQAVGTLLLEYRDQGITVNPIHFEVLLAAMTRFYKVNNPAGILTEGQVVTLRTLKMNGAEGLQVILGLSASALHQDGFLAAASFQRTRQILNNAALKAAVDDLQHRKTRLMAGLLV